MWICSYCVGGWVGNSEWPIPTTSTYKADFGSVWTAHILYFNGISSKMVNLVVRMMTANHIQQEIDYDHNCVFTYHPNDEFDLIYVAVVKIASTAVLCTNMKNIRSLDLGKIVKVQERSPTWRRQVWIVDRTVVLRYDVVSKSGFTRIINRLKIIFSINTIGKWINLRGLSHIYEIKIICWTFLDSNPPWLAEDATLGNFWDREI